MKLTLKHYIIFTAKVIGLALLLFTSFWTIWALSGQYPLFNIVESIRYFLVFSTVGVMTINYIKNTYE